MNVSPAATLVVSPNSRRTSSASDTTVGSTRPLSVAVALASATTFFSSDGSSARSVIA